MFNIFLSFFFFFTAMSVQVFLKTVDILLTAFAYQTNLVCFACCAKLVFLSSKREAAMMSKEIWLTWYWYFWVSMTRV